MDHSELISIFHERIKGRTLPPLEHDGSIGHWIENQFGVSANADDSADWFGYELKSGKTKTTFGDWSADYYIWKDPDSGIHSRDDFLIMFGTQSREDRPGRYSWSGRVFPTVHGYNEYGQIMEVDFNDDIVINYDFSMDDRVDKYSIIPLHLQSGIVELARWDSYTMEARVSKKFGQREWAKFEISGGVVDSMLIGPPMTFAQWINDVRTGEIFLDSGMYFDPIKPNDRPYSNWRANNGYWDSLAVDRIY